MEPIFKDNPHLDVAYKTADGKYFFLESDARNHASTLKDKKVEKVTPQSTGEAETVVAPAEEVNDEAIVPVDEVVNSDEAKEEPATKTNKKTKTKK